MKRFIGVIISFAIVLAACAGFCFAEETGGMEIEGAFQYAVSDEYVWIISEDTISVCDELLSETLCEFENPYDNLRVAAYGDRLYVLHAENDEYAVSEIMTTGEEGRSWIITAEATPLQIEATEKYIYILSNDAGDADAEYGAYGTMTRVSLDGGAGEAICADNYVSCFSVYNDTILAYDYFAGEIFVYDGAANEYVYEKALDNVEFCHTYNGEYFCLGAQGAGSTIYKIDMEKDAINEAYKTADWLAGMRGNGKYIYTVKTEEDTLCVISCDGGSASDGALKVGCFMYIPDDLNVGVAVDEFGKKYPDVEIEYIVYEDETVMYTDMMSGEADIDVYFLQDAGLVNPNAMYNGGALMDLSTSEAVAGAYGQLINMDGLTMYNGAMICVPRNAWVYMFEVNVPLFEEMGLDIPQNGWTWNDFFALGAQVEKLRDEGNDIFLLYNEGYSALTEQFYINAIYNGSVDCFDADYTAALTEWKEFIKQGLIVPFSEAVPYMPENALLGYTFTTHANYGYVTTGKGNGFVMTPRLNEQTGTVVTVMSVCVSSTTDMPEIAEAFAASFIEEPTVSNGLSIGTIGDIRKEPGQSYEPVDNFDYPSTDDELVWREILEDGVMRWSCGDLFDYAALTLYDMYINDEITIDEYGSMAQERADMVLGE